MDKLRKMAVFARVVELGSFAAAAADQNVTPAIVGRHVADLEAMLDQRLINRTTRSMEITEAGQRYYHGCKAMLVQLDALEQEVSDQHGSRPAGIIRLAAPEGLGSLLLDAAESFQAQYPEVLFDLIFDNAQTDFVSANVDIAVRLAISLEDSSLIVSKLSNTRLGLFAAPSYLEKNGTPAGVSDLGSHACLAFGGSRFGDSWPLVSQTGVQKLRQPWRLVMNQTHIYRDALVRGMGIGLLPEIMAADLVEAGLLSPVALDARFPDVGVFAVYPNRAFQPRRVSLFLQHLRLKMKP
ncbi:LysR family transcriptional regulator [Leisingera sp. ANG-M1]|uniref:LysR family transcriptional regulator n=1 Tax=Leisingera sp. ANG-M1 TaxID=1577895 RepID=UPI00057D0260|nr:LysR family transcriptional regulator [Leisingera sp. ANG-M1]KIC09078.1 LysR family transcriptional regulator [Leisingera sp. ANG-M1]